MPRKGGFRHEDTVHDGVPENHPGPVSRQTRKQDSMLTNPKGIRVPSSAPETCEERLEKQRTLGEEGEWDHL